MDFFGRKAPRPAHGPGAFDDAGFFPPQQRAFGDAQVPGGLGEGKEAVLPDRRTDFFHPRCEGNFSHIGGVCDRPDRFVRKQMHTPLIRKRGNFSRCQPIMQGSFGNPQPPGSLTDRMKFR